MLRAASLALALAASTRAQQFATNQAEVHPGLSSQVCTASGCTTQSTKIVLDANWRWLHTTSGYTNCYTGNKWDTTICPDATTCATACAVDGADYSGTYGISTSGNALTLKFVTKGSGTNIGSRVYLMADDTHYQMFKLLNKEFTFDVDMSNLPCGLNGALYFSEMAADGGLSKFPTNKAGAKYGTGYCDAQCPRDLKFINGKANVEGWNGADNDPNSGKGTYGTCCSEMDIWEANSNAAAYTPHPCTVVGQTQCSGVDCGSGDDRYNGVCDKDGCDFNSYRQGDTSFLGMGKTIDTKSKVTVVTQFITNDGTDTGSLSEIRRFYVQNGKTYANSVNKIAGIPAVNSITDNYCAAQKSTFGDKTDFQAKGGLKAMGAAMARGMVLVMSLWDDHDANALWLDSTYPVDSTSPGAARGPCATDSGVPADVEANFPNSSVVFSNIKTGTLNSTFPAGTVIGGGGSGGGSSSSSTIKTSSTTLKTSSTSIKTSSTSTKATSTTTASAPGGSAVPKYGQCGGKTYTGSTTCAAGSTCKVTNEFYSQCL